MDRLVLTSIQAGNADADCAALAAEVGRRLNRPVDFLALDAWQGRERAFDQGQAQVCWMCGAVYIRKLARGEGRPELLAAPVMAAQRYGGRPVYFSDVVVAADSRFQRFADLRGASWAYNEPNSHSGYTVTRWYLASHGYTGDFFGRTVAAGAHQRSLELVLAGGVDASAIDSTVLETELARRPDLVDRLRIIETFGPSPIPPWAMHHSLTDALKADLRQVFTGLASDPAGRAILAGARMARFVEVRDLDYDPLRTMTAIAQRVSLG